MVASVGYDDAVPLRTAWDAAAIVRKGFRDVIAIVQSAADRSLDKK